MDQLKQVLGQLAKHQFWIVTGFAVILGIAGFFMASSTINGLYTTQKAALDSHFTNLTNVAAAVSTHPNQESKKQMDLIIDGMAEDVRAAWASQWERQEPLLQWPVDAIASPTLVRKLKEYKPIELTLEYPEEPANIVDGEKAAYGRYFDEQMPRLAEIIGVTWVGEANASAAGGMGGGMGMEGGMGMGGYGGEGGSGGESGGMGMGGMGMGGMGMGGMGMGGMGGRPNFNSKRDIVTWPKPSQDELLTSIRMWTGDKPNVYQIVYTQENMWILEGLLNIIKSTNGDAKANFQTTIKEIEFIRIGRTAVGQAGDIATAKAGGGIGSGMPGGYGSEMMGEESEMGGAPDTSSMTSEDMEGEAATAVAPDPANGRYVDAAFMPISGEDLRTRMRSEDPSDAYFAVAKRVPVRLRLKIDQRKTHDFLANCGNADLMLEIRQVRLGNTTAAAAGGGGMAGGGRGPGGMGMSSGPGGMGMSSGPGGMGMGGGGMSMGDGEDGAMGGMGGMGMGGMGMGMGGMGMGGMGMGGGRMTKDPLEIPIEVYGVVYLFNPVNIDRLGLNKVTADTEMEVTVENPAEDDAPVPPAVPASENAQEAAEPTAEGGVNANGQDGENGGTAAGTGVSDGETTQPAGDAPSGN